MNIYSNVVYFLFKMVFFLFCFLIDKRNCVACSLPCALSRPWSVEPRKQARPLPDALPQTVPPILQYIPPNTPYNIFPIKF